MTENAETVTPAEGAETGNDLNADTLHDLGVMQELVLNQQAMIERLADQVESMSKTALGEPSPGLADPTQFEPIPVAEGWRRYGARFSELTLIRQAGKHIMINNTPIWEPQTAADFSGGVYETNDEGEIEWLESHPDFNITFWRDDYAIRRHSQVEVTTGVKTSVSTPRAPLAAPMKP